MEIHANPMGKLTLQSQGTISFLTIGHLGTVNSETSDNTQVIDALQKKRGGIKGIQYQFSLLT